MFKIPYLGVQAGILITLVIWLSLMVLGALRKRGKAYFIFGTLAQVIVLPIVSIAAMFAIAPFFEYRGSAADSESWKESWMSPPAKSTNMKFWKSTACEEFIGTTDREAWDAWRQTYKIANALPEYDRTPPETDLFKAIDRPRGEWTGYMSEVAPSGACRRTWFREQDGMMAYRRNYW